MFRSTSIVAILSALLLGAPAQAEIFKEKTGRVIFVPTAAPVDEKMADGSIIRKTAGTGIGIADLPFPFDYMKSMCQGYLHIGADGKPVGGRGMCEVLSSKGDKAAYIYVGNPTGGRYEWVEGSGTGAYKGISGKGTYKTVVIMPGGGVVNEYVGSWQTD